MTVVACALAASSGVSAYSDKGVLYADELTLPRLVDGSRDTLVVFDKEYAYGDSHDEFKHLAVQVGEGDANMLVLGISVRKLDGDKTAELASRYSAWEDEYPAYRLFKRGVSLKEGGEPLAYKGTSKKAQDVLAWVASNTGLFFGLKGQVKELNGITAEFVAAASPEAQKAALAKAEAAAKAVAGGDSENAAYYIKVMKKVIEKPNHAIAETARIKKLLEGQMSEEKQEAFTIKLNILSSFTAGSVPGKDEL